MGNKQELHELHMNYALSCMHGVQNGGVFFWGGQIIIMIILL